MTALIVIAWLIALASVVLVSQATMGVAGMCFACFLVIGARIVQADNHQKDILRALGARTPGQPMTIAEKAAAAGISTR